MHEEGAAIVKFGAFNGSDSAELDSMPAQDPKNGVVVLIVSRTRMPVDAMADFATANGRIEIPVPLGPALENMPEPSRSSHFQLMVLKWAASIIDGSANRELLVNVSVVASDVGGSIDAANGRVL